jgi:hypothetical protein
VKKILLVFEDYNELSNTEIYLKKIGFDVLGLSNEIIINDHLISFNPDIVVAFGKSQRVNTLSLGAKLKENRKFLGKVVLVMPQGIKPGPQEISKLKMDALMEAPLDPFRVIQTLAKLGKLDTAMLIEKLKKATLSDPNLKSKINFSEFIKPTDDTQWVKEKEGDRQSKYTQFIKETPIDTHQTTFQKSDIKSRQAELKKDWNFEELEELDRLKREFAEALFKKS